MRTSANGGVFMDDTGDPAQTLDMYEDGDHLSREGRRLAPWTSSPFERQAGLHLFLLVFGYSIPLWTHSIWIELHRGLTRPDDEASGLGRAALKALACGAAFTAILVLRSRTSLDFIYFQF